MVISISLTCRTLISSVLWVNVELTSDNRLDHISLTSIIESKSTIHISMIGYRKSRHSISSGFFHVLTY